MPDDPWPDSRQFLASMARLYRAGIVETVVHDERTGEGTLSWTPSYLKLLLAGRQVFNEPDLLAAWATGDPLAVRAWIEREAALIPDRLPASVPQRVRRPRKSGKR